MTTRRLGTLGALWAAVYVPIHVYWALGGSVRDFGVDDPGPDWALANWAACVLIAGAGGLCLALTRAWGSAVPLRRGVAIAGGTVALAHWALFSVTFVVSGLDAWGWWNLLVFEPWFGVMGLLLVGCARRANPGPVTSRPAAAVILAGVLVTVGGLIVFSPWVFLGAGPVLTVAGLAWGHTSGRSGARPRADAAGLVPAGR